MCLNTLADNFIPKHDPKKPLKAWKIMQKDGYTPFQTTALSKEWSHASTGVLKTHDWANRYNIRSRNQKEYLSGFHVFLTRREARQALRLVKNCLYKKVKIVPVEVDNIVAYGYDGTSDETEYTDAKLRCVVARTIRLL